jgi:hypothetical protein
MLVYAGSEAQDRRRSIEQVCGDRERRRTMGWAFGVGVTVGMILLRLVVPLAITVALSYALHRLDAKWHPEVTGEN